MADLNALIAQGAEFKVPDFFGSYAKFAQIQGAQRENALAQMKMDEYSRSLDEQNRLRAYLQGSDVTTPEGRKGLIQFGKTGLELGKTLLEQEKEAALRKKADVETSAAESNLIDSKLKQSRAFLDTIDPNDPNAANQYIAWHEANHRDPVLGPVLTARGITAESARANIMQKLNQPGGVATLIEQSRLGSEKFQERIRPKPKQVERADGSIIFMDENPDSPTFGKEIMPSQAAGMTPYQKQQLAATLRGQNLTDARAREQIAQGKIPAGYRAKADGTLEFIPGGPADPKTGGAKPLTEGQGSSVAYGMRMAEADKILRDLEKKGEKDTGLLRSGVSGTVGAIPLIGESLGKGVDNVFNVLPSIMGGLSPAQQQTMQARINFITAVLRKESGASISPTEFATAEKNYFPAPGEGETVIKQKQKARETAIKAMKVQAGPGAAEIDKHISDGWEVVKK